MPRAKKHHWPATCAVAGAVLAAGASALADPVTVCTTAPTAIPDDASNIVVPLIVTDTGTVESVEIDLDITHPWVGDLTVTLAKDAATVDLLDRVSLGTYPFGCGGDDVQATFSDAALVTPEDLCSPAVTPVIAGSVLPAQSLAPLAGLDAAGTWEILITDAGIFDAGTLNAACITITLAPPADCVGDLDDDDDTDVFDFGILAANFGQSVPANTGGDLDGNAVVDVFDFGILAGDFGCVQ